MLKTTLAAATLVAGLAAVLAVVGADEARTDTSAFTIALTAAPAGETPVIAIVDTGTGKVRSCWLTGPVSKPNCSQWSD